MDVKERLWTPSLQMAHLSPLGESPPPSIGNIKSQIGVITNENGSLMKLGPSSVPPVPLGACFVIFVRPERDSVFDWICGIP